MKTQTKKKLSSRMEFTAKERRKIHERDRERCVFCEMGYQMPEDPAYCRTGLQIMHIVPRSQLGMGVEQNGALGCVWHHNLMDNGNRERRKEMMTILERRMEMFYPGWSRNRVTYSKYAIPDLPQRATLKAKSGSSQGKEMKEGNQNAD